MSRPDDPDPSPPPLVKSIAAVRRSIAAARTAGRRIALVPTMGALHAGHLSLVVAAKTTGDYIVLSIYVNPAQFGPNEDYDAYPRTLEADRAACREAGVDLIFTPSNEAMYPPGDQTRIAPGPLAEPLCGRFRPGHFEGVCTVVAKLLNIVQPDAAYFGRKDAQQAIVIRRMVRDLCLPVRIEECPIIREPDGLAMSSRNAYLSPAERDEALRLYQALRAGRDLLLSGEASIERVTEVMQETASSGPGSMLTVEYLTVVDAETLETLVRPRDRMMLAGAIRIGETRLIDNLLVDLEADRE